MLAVTLGLTILVFIAARKGPALECRYADA